MHVESMVRLEGARRSQHGLPLGGVHRAAHVVRARQEYVVLDIEDAGCLVGPLDQFSELDEFPSLVAGIGGLGQALEEVRVALYLLEEILRARGPDLGPPSPLE